MEIGELVGALVAERWESCDKKMEKLFIGRKIFDGEEEIIVKAMKNTGGFAEGASAFGEERNSANGVGGMEKVLEIGVGEGGEVGEGDV